MLNYTKDRNTILNYTERGTQYNKYHNKFIQLCFISLPCSID